ncbi:MAG: ABC transporter permease [Haloarculaceae archaeon]
MGEGPPWSGESGVPSATRFDELDPDQPGDPGAVPAASSVGFLSGIALIAAGFYHEHVRGGSLPLVSNIEPLDWLFAASLLGIAAFVVAPLANDPRRARQYWRRLRRRPAALVSLGLLLVLVVVGLLGPLFVSKPQTVAFDRAYQPPVGFSVDTKWLFTPESCVGPIRHGRCHGTLQYPLGTTNTGQDMVPLVVLGTHTALQVAVVATALIVPAGVGFGLLAAYARGRAERLLMRVAEVCQTVPAVVVYILFWGWNAEYRLLALVGAFGLTGWAGLARLVRNEALQLRDRPYVAAARGTGATSLQVVRWHLLPNVSRSVLTNATLQIPLIVFTEAALSFIVVPSPFNDDPVSLGDATVVSWGGTINLGTQVASLEGGWWIATIPALLLVATMLSVNLVGRGLGEVLDPRSK